jgi:hypothetical protein
MKTNINKKCKKKENKKELKNYYTKKELNRLKLGKEFYFKTIV